MKRLLILIFFLLATSACTSSNDALTIHDTWARPASAGDNGAAYFVIENGTITNDTLLSISSDIATATEVHMSMGDGNGVMSMQMQESVPVPARSQVEFKPGGLHVMFVNLTRDLKEGDTIILTLNFEKTGSKLGSLGIAVIFPCVGAKNSFLRVMPPYVGGITATPNEAQID